LIEERLFLIVAYVAIAALLLSFYFYSTLSKTIKIFTIFLVTLFYFFTWYSLEALLGWPSQQDMPEKFRILWIDVQEPQKKDGQEGEIYFWVKNLNASEQPFGKPRAYSIRWSEENAQKAEEALSKMDDGQILNGNISRNILSGDRKKSEGSIYEEEGSSSSEEGEPSFEFKEIEPPALPPKRPVNG
tara:strand:+ start:1359 stop:1919 length:561 start_codon:yes stop_codon:yes gene_type:complete